MRCLVGLLLFPVLVASALGVSAQDAEQSLSVEPELEEEAAPSDPTRDEGGLSPRLRKRTLQKWDPGTYDVRPSRPASQESTLQLELYSEGSEFALIPPSPPPKRGLDARQRAGIGLGVSIAAVGAGIGMTTAAVGGSFTCILAVDPCATPAWVAPVGISGALLLAGGIIGMAVSGKEMRSHPSDRAGSGSARRAQWDPGVSRLAF